MILQVGFFKLTKGRRLFRMAPLHHHFEMLGWEEITVTIRFWLIAGIFVAAGLGVFYAEWVAGVMNVGRPRPRQRLGRRPRRRGRLRRLRVRRRGQPDLPRRPGHRPRRVRRGRPARAGRPAREPRRQHPARCRVDATAARRRRPRGHLARLGTDGPAAGAGRRARRTDLGRGRARLAAARPRRTRRPGSRSPAPTARPRPCRCSRRCCAPPGCARSPAATSGCPSSRR